MDRDGTFVDLPETGERAWLATEFQMGEQLGTGGMSEVRLARQTGLDRWVAVKSATSEVGEAALINEARVSARLNCSGVVPVFDVGQDEQGRTALFMQRIEGRTWRSFMHDDRTLEIPEGVSGDPLAWHLGVLSRVARVVQHAHGVGIAHRDIKPGNVMVGREGEVYLMDWGLAVATDERQADLPRAIDIDRFSGTTGHAAPEMLDTRHRLIGERTDIYQLGTCLHMLLTGSPPHADRLVADRLRSILRSEPPAYGAEVPSGLAAICHRAMARRPADRFADVGLFLRAVASVGAELRSMQQARDGLQRLVALRRLIAGRQSVERITEHFAEARYTLRDALRAWPENPLALDGLQTLLETVILYDLLRGHHDRPRRLLGALPRPRPDLDARLERPGPMVRLLPPRIPFAEAR